MARNHVARFEAIKCAERQGPELAAELDWAIRTAFFAESRCISMRHILFDLAERSGLEMARFAEDFDGGVTKGRVLEEARAGWERLKVEGSPTLVLPSGEQISYLGLPKVTLDEEQHARVVGLELMCAQAAAGTGTRLHYSPSRPR